MKARRHPHIRKEIRAARRLEHFTIGWNFLEALVAVTAGAIASSIALVGFGFDSLIESLSGGVLLWRLQHDTSSENREATALKLVGFSFFILAIYVGIGSAKTLIYRELPETSAVGIILAIVSLVMMPVLARAKRRVAVRIQSRALTADSRQTDICAYLSAILLAGLTLNALFGWWWADPVAALCMLPLIISEGVEAVRGRTCCA